MKPVEREFVRGVSNRLLAFVEQAGCPLFGRNLGARSGTGSTKFQTVDYRAVYVKPTFRLYLRGSIVPVVPTVMFSKN